MTTKDNKNVETVSTMLNDFGFSAKGFCESMTREHRTLQQSFTRLCIEWLQTCADAEYRYDGRNEASHEVAKALINSQDADFLGLPFV